MKTHKSLQLVTRILPAVVLGWLLHLALLPVSAASFFLTNNDAINSVSSWTNKGNWNSSAAPSAGNDYFTSNRTIRTPQDVVRPAAFAGSSLSIDPGGSLLTKHKGPFTNSLLLLNGGSISLGGGGNNDAVTNFGTIRLNDTTNMVIGTDQPGRSIDFQSTIIGTGSSILMLSNMVGTIQSNMPGVTLSGANLFTNILFIASNTVVRANNNRAFGSTAGPTVISNSTVDLNGFTNTEPFFVWGTGTNNAGAIINSGSAMANNGLRGAVALIGDTTFGGANRWDIFGPGTLAGNGFKLTKAGANEIALASLGNTGLGDIAIGTGTLTILGNTTMGDPAKTATVTAGALNFWAVNNTLATPLSKVVVVQNGASFNNSDSTTYFSGPFTFNGGANVNANGTGLILLGNVTLGGNANLNAANSQLTILASIGGPGGFFKGGANRLVLAGTNTYTGSTVINAISGTLQLSTNGSIAASPQIIVNAGSLFDVSLVAGGFALSPNQNLSGAGQVNGNISGQPGSLFTGNGMTIMGNVTNAAGAIIAPAGYGVAGGINLGQSVELNNGSILAFDLTNSVTLGSGTNDLIIVGGDLTLNGNVLVNFSFLTGSPVLGQRYTLIKYYGTRTGGAVNLAAISAAFLSTFDDTTPGEIGVTFSAGTANALTWGGDGSANRWEVGGALNWTNVGVPSAFAPGDNTVFDDASSNPTVNLVGALAAGSVTVNSSSNYTLAGSGSLVAGTINKQGTGTLSVNTANAFNEPTTISDGVLKTGNALALGTAAGGTTISGTGTLDVNGQNLGAESVTVSGAGHTNGGAIINTGGSQQNALRFVTLAGDTTFGGNQRWDIRNSPTATLSSGGQPFKITKVGTIANYMTLVGVTVDPALGDIDIQGGGFGYETTTTSLGDPNKTLNIGANAYFLMYQTVYPLNKRITIQAGGTNRVDSLNNTNLGPITLVSGFGSFDIRSPLAVLSQIDGAGSLVKVGGSTLYLLGTNIYTGGTLNTAGTLQGTTDGLQGFITNNATLTFEQNFDGIFAGAVTGTGTINKQGTGRVLVNSATALIGATNAINVNAGWIALGADDALGTLNLNFNGGGLTAADSTARRITNFTTWSQSVPVVIALGAAGTGELLFQGPPANNGSQNKWLAISNNLVTFSNTLYASGTLTKSGPGQLQLGGTNMLAGLTNREGLIFLGPVGYFSNFPNVVLFPGSVLDVSASTLAGGNFALGTNRTLIAGRTSGFANDIVGGIISTGAVVIVSNGIPGTLTVSGGLTLSGGNLTLDLATPGIAGGGVNDLIAIGGPLNLAGLTTINLNPLGGPLAAGTYTLIGGGTTLAAGSAANLTLAGTNGSSQLFTLDVTSNPGSVLLVVGAPAAPLVWAGFPSANWDVNSSVAWLSGGSPSKFYNLAATVIDPTAVNPNINLTATVLPGSLSVSGPLSYFYTVSGSGKISGSAGIDKTGDSTLLLSTANDFTGPIVVTGGQVRIGNAGALGNASTITVTGGGQIEMNGQNVGNARAYTYFLSGAGFDGTGVFKNSGAGAGDVGSGLRYVTLLGDSTFGGTGRLDIGGNDVNLGWLNGGGYRLITTNADRIALRGSVTGVSEFVLNRGILYGEQFSGQFTTLVTVNPGASLGAYSYTAPGSITNSAAITLNGGTLGAGGQAAGQRVVWTGPVTVTANSFVNTVLLNGNDDLRLEGLLNGAANLAVSGAKLFELAADSRPTYAGNITINSGATLRLADLGATGSGLVTNFGTFDFTQPALNAFTNVILGTGTIAKNGTNILQLAGSGEQFDNLATLNVNSGLLDLNSLSETVRNLGGGGVITNSGAGSVLTLANPSGGQTFSGNIVGDVQVVIKDAVTKNTTVQIFSGSNRFTGKLVIDNGHLRAANDWFYGAVPLTFDPNNITLKNGGAVQNNDSYLSLNANRGIFLENGDGVFYAGWTKDITVNGIISGPGNLVKTDGGRLLLNNVNTYAGNTLINQGRLVLTAFGSISTSPLINIASGAFLDVQAFNGFPLAPGQTLAGAGSVLGSPAVGSGATITPGTSVGTLNISNNLVFNGGRIVFELGSVTNQGGAFNDLITVGGNLSITAPTTIKIEPFNGTLSSEAPYTLFTYGGSIIGNPSDLTVVTDSRYAMNLDFSVPGRVLLVISGGAAGSLTWMGDANLTAPWDLNFTEDWQLSDFSTAVFKAGDFVTFNNSDATPNVSLTGTLVPGGITVNSEFGDYVFTGPGRLAGGIGLFKTGSYGLTIANAGLNEYPGPTIITNGTVQVGIGGTVGNLPGTAITNNGTLIYNRSDNFTLPNIIAGTGGFQKDGGNILTLSGVSAFTGPIAVNSGTIRVGNAAAFGYNSAITVNNGAQVDLAGIAQGPARGFSYTLAGNGPDGRGALLNTGGAVLGNSAVSNITLTADTSIGVFGTTGTDLGRVDIGTGSTVLGQYGLFNGGDFTLTKVGPGVLTIRVPSVNFPLAVVSNGTLKAENFDFSLATNILVYSNASIAAYGGRTNSSALTLFGGATNYNDGGSGYVAWLGPITNLGPATFAVAGINGNGNIGLFGNLYGSSFYTIANGFSRYVDLWANNDATFTGNWSLPFSTNTLRLSGSGTPGMGVVTNNGAVDIYNTNATTLAATILGIGNVNQQAGAATITLTGLVQTAFVRAQSGNFGSPLTFGAGADIQVNNTFHVAQANSRGAALILPGASLKLANFFLGEGGSQTGQVAQVGGDIIVTNQFRVGHWGNNVSSYLMGDGTMSVIGTPTGVVNPSGQPEQNGILYVGIDGVGLFTQTGGVVSAHGVVLDARGATVLTPFTNTYALEGGTLLLGPSGIKSGNLDGNPATIYLGGGNLGASANWAAARPMILTGTNGNTVIDPSANIVTLSGALSGAGGFIKQGSGSLYLLGTNTYAGQTLINDGAVYQNGSLASGAALVTVAGGTLGGTGSITAPVTVLAAGTLAPGFSIGTLTVNGPLTLGGATVMEINKTGAVRTADKVTGISTLSYGGALTVVATGDALAAGDVFDLFDATTFSGSFASVTLPPLGGALVWDLSRLSVDGTIVVTAPPAWVAGPTDQTVECSSNATFTVAVTSAGTLQYQWYFGPAPIANATNVTLTLNNVSSANNGSYTVAVTNAAGGLVAGPATLTVNDTIAPTISCPAPLTVQSMADVPAANTGSVTATDGCDASPVVTFEGDSIAYGTPAIITRTYKATDSSGNSATCTQIIQVLIAVPSIASYEPFRAYTNGSLGGQLYGGSGYLAGGAWTLLSGDVSVTTNSSLGFTNGSYVLSVTGGQSTTPAASFNGVIADLATNAGSALAAAGLVDNALVGGGNVSGALYYSFLARNGSANVPDGAEDFAGLQLYRDGAEIFGVGNNWAAWAYSTFGIGGDGDLVRPSDSGYKVMDNTVHLFVVKVQYVSGADDTVTVWMDPDLAADETTQPNTIYQRSLTGDASFNRVAVRSGSSNNDNSWDFDEIRFGTNWAGVTPTLPAITVQPASLTADCTSNATFAVTVAGTAPIGYQWYFGAALIPDATNASLTVVAVSGAGGSYSVRVLNAFGSVTSEAATLTVLDTLAPTITCPAPVAVQCLADVPAANIALVTAVDWCDPAPMVAFVGDVTNGVCPTIITRTYAAYDAAGNTNTCTQTITVQDTTPPVITCPANLAVQCATDVPAANFAGGSVSDNCDPAPVVSLFSETSVGVNPTVITRVYVAADVCGNTNICTQTITVQDTIAPIIATAPNITTTNDLGVCGAVVSFASPGATDNCGVPVVACLPASGSAFAVGTTIVTCTATDTAGNTNASTFTVTVNDVEAPTIATLSSITTTNDLGVCGAAVTFTAPAANDNCPGVTVACIPASGSTFTAGATIVTCTATDAAGNTNAMTFTVTVSDVEAPTIATASNITTTNDPGVCGAAVTFTAPAAGDNCAGVTVGCVPASGSTFTVGATIVTCTATDAVGNTNASTFTVTVNDVEAPTITNCAPAMTIYLDTNTCLVEIPNLTTNIVAGDACGAVSITQQPPAGTSVGLGETNVTLVVKDAANNEATCVAVVTVADPVTNITLTVTVAASDVVLTWPKTCADWKLQETPGFSSPITWANSTNTPVLNVDLWKVIVPANTGTNLFYQLKRNLP